MRPGARGGAPAQLPCHRSRVRQSSSSSEKTISSSESSAAICASRSRVRRCFSASFCPSSSRSSATCSGSSGTALASSISETNQPPPSRSSAYWQPSSRSTSKIRFTSVGLKVRRRSLTRPTSASANWNRKMCPCSRKASTNGKSARKGSTCTHSPMNHLDTYASGTTQACSSSAETSGSLSATSRAYTIASRTYASGAACQYPGVY
mmetsp:Transcript_25567/g.82493  ORF Transcript_25567/g.82493 Transcript_25567/m.82493 type:complete len:207 (+) Transcript_25567:389-1009(+)